MLNSSSKVLLIGNSYEKSIYNKLPSHNDIEKMLEICNKLNIKDITVKKDVFLEETLKNFFKTVKKDENVFIYFSGHGGDLTGSKNLPEIGLLSSWINCDGSFYLSYYLDKFLSESKEVQGCNSVVIVSDSCYAGNFLKFYSPSSFSPKIMFIGASDIASRTLSYLRDGKKYGALCLLLEYLFTLEDDKREINLDNIKEKTEKFRRENRFLRNMVCKNF